jgi:uncharacterized membrane protein YvlD (DUF360 family)
LPLSFFFFGAFTIPVLVLTFFLAAYSAILSRGRTIGGWVGLAIGALFICIIGWLIATKK